MCPHLFQIKYSCHVRVAFYQDLFDFERLKFVESRGISVKLDWDNKYKTDLNIVSSNVLQIRDFFKFFSLSK